MSNVLTNKMATILLVVLFCMPALVTVSLLPFGTPEADQYSGLMVVLMGIYNIPFLLFSFIFLGIAKASAAKAKTQAAKVMLALSSLVSISGIAYFVYWGVEAATA